MINQQLLDQKQSSIIQISKKITRGSYSRVSPWLKHEILYRINTKKDALDDIFKSYNVNKETIRSISKNVNKKTLYSNLECFMVKKYFEQNNSQHMSIDQIKSYIKNLINNYQEDNELKEIIEEIQLRREHSKIRNKKSIILFNSNNRRIIKKIVCFINLADAAASKDTVKEYIDNKIKQEFYHSFIYNYYEKYGVSIQGEESQNSQLQDQEDITPSYETKQYFQ